MSSDVELIGIRIGREMVRVQHRTAAKRHQEQRRGKPSARTRCCQKFEKLPHSVCASMLKPVHSEPSERKDRTEPAKSRMRHRVPRSPHAPKMILSNDLTPQDGFQNHVTIRASGCRGAAYAQGLFQQALPDANATSDCPFLLPEHSCVNLLILRIAPPPQPTHLSDDVLCYVSMNWIVAEPRKRCG